jgi:hypothetical protein
VSHHIGLAVSHEIAGASERLARRMPLQEALGLAIRTADEAQANHEGWERVTAVKEALAKIVGPAPLTCPSCGAIVSCPLCGANGKAT